MGQAAAWTKRLAVAAAVLLLAAGASAPAAVGHLSEPGSYDLESATSDERLGKVLNRHDSETITFLITAEGHRTADISVTPPAPFGVGARYITKPNLTEAELGRFRAESRAENRRLHRRRALPAAVRVPVAHLRDDDRFTVRASTAREATCGGRSPWYLEGGICGSSEIGPNRARCVAVYAGRIVAADLGSTMSACEVDRSDLKDSCGFRPCGPGPTSDRHGRATVVTGLRDDGSLDARDGDLVTVTIAGPPGREADITLPAERSALPPDGCERGWCPDPQPRPQRRRLPYTYSVPAAEIARARWSGTGDYSVRATTNLNVPECPRSKNRSAIVLCSYAGPGSNVARCVATYRDRVIATDLGGTFATCPIDPNDLRTS